MTEKTLYSPKEPQLTMERTFDGPRELVFKVWTEPAHIEKWWGPHKFKVPHCEIDLRPGGTFLICMRSPEGDDYWNKGMFQEIIPEQKIVSTLYFCDEEGNFVPPSAYGMGTDFPSEAVLTVTFAELDKKTKVTLNYGIPVSIAKRYGVEDGWIQSFERFETELLKSSH
ncbi:SRPBCC domain-containing protein [Bdellovibrio sp. 22V]|uniref:SRPBCC family protein n=1 Tax=Bdellovibrio TaxID=958 RepID=UPI002543B0D2|nr:SRPBCC domain-containing protein [Bdellovibrio sp. 22V]WII72610.1 SRPBCC domain-containing protein [Bdellovibrio sp. 22V]